MSITFAARLAGAMFLLLIAAVLGSSTLNGGALSGSDDIGATFRAIAADTTDVRLSIVLNVFAGIATLVLATMLYTVTKRQDENLAILALICRAVEAALYTVGIVSLLILLSLSPAPTASQQELGAVVTDVASWSTNVGAIFFAVGSALFAYLLLRGRSVPVALAALGVVASVILVVGVPWETATGRVTTAGPSIVMWLPMFAFEITAGVWLLLRGTRTPVTEPAS